MSTPTLITISGVIANSEGTLAGRLVFAAKTLVRNATTDAVMVPHERVVDVPDSGVFSVQIPATNDPAWSPSGWTWEVRPHFDGWRDAFSVAVPYDSPGAALAFSDLVEVPPDGDVQLYALVNHVHAGGGEGGPIAISDVTGLTAALAGKQASGSYAAASHTHTISNVTGLQTALDGKADDSEITALDGRLDTLEAVGPTIFSWNGSAYVADADARLYVGPGDPGSVPDGSVWIDTTP